MVECRVIEKVVYELSAQDVRRAIAYWLESGLPIDRPHPPIYISESTLITVHEDGSASAVACETEATKREVEQ